MYVNKMIFVEGQDVKNIEKFGIIQFTDYNTYEISNYDVQDLKKNLQGIGECDPDEYDFTLQEFEEEMENSLGNAYNMLLNEELDFVQVVY